MQYTLLMESQGDLTEAHPGSMHCATDLVHTLWVTLALRWLVRLVVSSAGGHACALMDSGAVHAWGCNLHHQCGTGMDSSTLLPLPALVTGLGGLRITHIAAGLGHTLACSDAGNTPCS